MRDEILKLREFIKDYNRNDEIIHCLRDLITQKLKADMSLEEAFVQTKKEIMDVLDSFEGFINV